MQSPRYITPRLGGKSLAVLAGLFLIGLLASSSIATGAEGGDASRWPLLTKLGSMLGVTFGFGSGLCWMMTVLGHPLPRVLSRVLIVIVFSYALSIVGTSDWLQHTLNLAGLITVQSMWFRWLRVPDWAAAGGEVESRTARGHQFQIADLLALTTVAACLLALLTYYVTPAPRDIYWLGLGMIWCVGPLIAGCFVHTSLSRSLNDAMQRFVLGTCLICLVAVALASAQAVATGVAMMQNVGVPYFYAMFFWTYGVTLLGIGFAGRFQAGWDALDAQPDGDTPTDGGQPIQSVD